MGQHLELWPIARELSVPFAAELLRGCDLIRRRSASCVSVKLNIFHLALAGLKAGDEILEINNRAAGTLNSSMLKDFLAQPSLGLLVRTYPELEGGAELLESPPHRVDGPVDLGESPLAFLAGNPGMAVPSAGRTAEPRSARGLGCRPFGLHSSVAWVWQVLQTCE